MQPFNLSGTKWLTQQFNSISLTFIYVYVIRTLFVGRWFVSLQLIFITERNFGEKMTKLCEILFPILYSNNI